MNRLELLLIFIGAAALASVGLLLVEALFPCDAFADCVGVDFHKRYFD